ncbi:BON domain-containing protein, partial [candidate division KSB1 bacterium]|nr:BON domain-containing protein [candidate division KSB1 bacterium]
GVLSVINNIDVNPKITTTDAEIEEQINQVLMKNPAIEANEVEVNVLDGIVTLNGVMDSHQEKMICEEVVKGVSGVIGVVNQINIEYATIRPDDELKAEIKNRLQNDVRVEDAYIEVDVDDGNVELTGYVGSAIEKVRAIEDSWVSGVMSVNANKIEIDYSMRNEMKRNRYIPDSDEDIKEAVENALKYDIRVHPTIPKVEVNNGVVILKGIVDHIKVKQAAEQDALNTVGVWRVKNHLKVRPDLEVADKEISKKIREAIKSDIYIEQYDVAIFTRNGIVHIGGTVGSPFVADRVEKLASDVEGVVAIKNNLNTESIPQDKVDWELMQDIKDELYWNPTIDSDNIDVEVINGVATLVGEVDSWYERNLAPIEAYQAGAIEVKNHLNTNIGPDYYRKNKE